MSTKSGETELLVFDDFCTLYQAGFWNFFNDLPLQQKSLTVRVGLDLDRLDDDCRLFEHVYATLNRLLDINFIFYDIKDIERSNLLIMKDSFVIQYALSKTGSFMMCSHISNGATVRDIYEISISVIWPKDRLRLFPILWEWIIPVTARLFMQIVDSFSI